jgi:hypothetical protein
MGFKYLGIPSGLDKSLQEVYCISQIDDLLPKSKRSVYYVSQDNYVVTYVDGFSDKLKLYADSATSCVIVVVTGKDQNGKDMIAMAHLSRYARFQYFFTIIDACFKGEVRVYASGANPPEPIPVQTKFDYTAFRNAVTVLDWVHDYRKDINDGLPPCPKQGNIQIVEASLSFGQGNPSVYTNSLDCFGIESKDGTVSHTREWLSNDQRDISRGVQTLFCIFGDSNMVRPQIKDFLPQEISPLVEKAKNNADFVKAADMEDAEILQKFSSTPDFEVPWFCDTIREASQFVKNYHK